MGCSSSSLNIDASAKPTSNGKASKNPAANILDGAKDGACPAHVAVKMVIWRMVHVTAFEHWHVGLPEA